MLGADYVGDTDAPRVEVVSEPLLGHSMDLPSTDAGVWATLESTATALAARCDVYGIACNTLNVYARRLRALDLPADLVTPPDAVRAWAAAHEVESIGLLGARPVATLTEWSPYAPWTAELRIETPPDVDALHRLIVDIKADGGAAASLRDRFTQLAGAFDSRHLLLACTELPIVATAVEGKHLVDPTDLLAAELVRRWSEMAAD
jgi:aspartate racemase